MDMFQVFFSLFCSFLTAYFPHYVFYSFLLIQFQMLSPISMPSFMLVTHPSMFFLKLI